MQIIYLVRMLYKFIKMSLVDIIIYFQIFVYRVGFKYNYVDVLILLVRMFKSLK